MIKRIEYDKHPGGIKTGTKRFYLEGADIFADCPKCGNESVYNNEDYLDYPILNKTCSIRFYCKVCDIAGIEDPIWNEKVFLRLVVEKPRPEVFPIIINGKNMTIKSDSLTYSELCDLAGTHEGASVIFGHGKGNDRSAGEVCRGESVDLEEGMYFTIVHTNNA